MALSRLALRLTALEAVCPSAALPGGPFPTVAKELVFDSALGPIDQLNPDEQRPVIVVYTEADEGTGGQARGGPPFKCMVDLCFEISVVLSAQVPGGSDYETVYPQTDGEMEASLDMLEAQIRFALFFGPTGALWRKLTARAVTEIHSLPHHTGEERIRLARRTVRMTTQVSDDVVDPAPASAPAGLDRLPKNLRDVIEGLATTSYGYKLGLGLAPDAPVMPTAVPLKAVGLNEQTAAPDGSFAVDGSGAPVIDTPNEVTGLDQ